MILCFQNDLEVLDLFMLSSRTCFFFFNLDGSVDGNICAL